MAKRTKTVKRGCRGRIQRGIWLASAPLHEAGKTTKSGSTLKPGIRREELGFASDNFYFFQASFRSRLNHPYPRAERCSEKALRCFLVSSRRKAPSKCSVYKRGEKGALPEVRVTLCFEKIPVSPQKLPSHPRFEILHLPAGTFRPDARRKPSPLMHLSWRTGIWRR